MTEASAPAARRARSTAGHARRPRRSAPAVWRWMIPVLIVALAAAIPLLVWYAADAIYRSADGELTARITDPAAPGYEVAVLPSPSHLLLGEGPDEQLAMVVVMSLAADDQGGSALLLPPETVLDDGRRLLDVYRDDGDDDTREALATLLGVDFDATSVLDDEGWTQLLTPVGDLPVDITEDLVGTGIVALTDDGEDDEGEAQGEETGGGRNGGRGEGLAVRWQAGPIAIAPDDVSSFVGWLNPDEDPFNRYRRQDRFWRAWLAAVAVSDDPAIVPGEIDSGLGRFIRGLAIEPFIEEPSVSPADTDLGPGFELDVPGLRDVILEMIPFPLPAEEGSRPRVRLLDGVGGLDVATVYAPPLVRSGAQISILGNASTFGVTTTTVVYHDEDSAEQAEAFGEIVDAGEVRYEPIEGAAVDMTIIIGTDSRR